MATTLSAFNHASLVHLDQDRAMYPILPCQQNDSLVFEGFFF